MAEMNALFNKFEQIAFVVDDLYAAMKMFCEDYGIGPWTIMRFGDAGDGNDNFVSIEDVRLGGRETGTYAIINGMCYLPENGLEIELIQPISGESIFADYLNEHGPGVQHLSIAHGDFDECLSRIRMTGHGISQLATVDKIETCVFSDHSDVIGSALELHRRPEDFVMPDIENELYPADGRLPEGCEKRVSAISRLCISTEDMDAAISCLRDEYGIGPWEPSGDGGMRCSALNVELDIQPGTEGDIGMLLFRGDKAHEAPLGYNDLLGVCIREG